MKCSVNLKTEYNTLSSFFFLFFANILLLREHQKQNENWKCVENGLGESQNGNNAPFRDRKRSEGLKTYERNGFKFRQKTKKEGKTIEKREENWWKGAKRRRYEKETKLEESRWLEPLYDRVVNNPISNYNYYFALRLSVHFFLFLFVVFFLFLRLAHFIG